nr:F-box protein At3g22700-like [Lolium perenne]
MEFEEANSKKQIDDECLINCLTGDLVERIFFRLPVSTLLRCVGVCKQWKKMIRDPKFATLHLQHASRYAILFFQQESIARKCYPSDAILVDEAWSQSTYAVPVIGPNDLLCGSCNGLICLYTNTSTIKIANLATGESMRIEKPLRNLKGDHFSFYTFGFHPLKKEYKITHFLSDNIDGPFKNKDRFNVIQVYTLGDEKWKDIKTPEALSLNCVRNAGAINIDGIVYWIIEDIAARRYAIMSFDLSEERFVRIQLPTPLPEHYAYGSWKFFIREIDGKICIAIAQTFHYALEGIFGKVQIWTLENKLEQKWSQKYNVDTSNYLPGPSLLHGGKLLTQSCDNKLFTYKLLWNGVNFETELNEAMKLLDFGPRKPENLQSYIFVESLVRLDIYKKYGSVRRKNKSGGWELKKWKTWENNLSEREEMWIRIHRKEHERVVC